MRREVTLIGLALSLPLAAGNVFEIGTGEGFNNGTSVGSLNGASFSNRPTVRVTEYNGLQVVGVNSGANFNAAALNSPANLIDLRFSQPVDFGFDGPSFAGLGANTAEGLIFNNVTAIPPNGTFSVTFGTQGAGWGPLFDGPATYNSQIGSAPDIDASANASAPRASSFAFRVNNPTGIVRAEFGINTLGGVPLNEEALIVGNTPTTANGSGLGAFDSNATYSSAVNNNGILTLLPPTSGGFGGAIRDQGDLGPTSTNIIFDEGTITFVAGSQGIPANTEFRFSVDGAPVIDPVPEPTGAILAAIGFLGLLSRRSRS